MRHPAAAFSPLPVHFLHPELVFDVDSGASADELDQPHGHHGSGRVGAVPSLTALAATKAAVESLEADMKHDLETLSPASPAYAATVDLFIRYDAYVQEFEGWYAVATDSTIDGSDDAKESLPSYQQRYREFRAAYVAGGGHPSSTSDALLDTSGPTDWAGVVKWGIIAGLVIAVGAPAAIALAGKR